MYIYMECGPSKMPQICQYRAYGREIAWAFGRRYLLIRENIDTKTER